MARKKKKLFITVGGTRRVLPVVLKKTRKKAS